MTDLLHALLDKLTGRRVLIVGDVMLDEYQQDETACLSLEDPTFVVKIQSPSFAPGGAGNVAANVVALGGSAVLVGFVGQDAEGQRLRDILSLHRIGTDILVEVEGRPTTSKKRVIGHGYQCLLLSRESTQPLPPSTEETLLRSMDRALEEIDACVLSDYGKGVVSARVAKILLQGAREKRLPVVVDPKGSAYEKYGGATLVKPNVSEVERVLNKEIVNETDLEEAGRRLVRLLDGSAVLITRGAKGMSLFRQGEQSVHIPAITRQVSDETGAGDTVAATLALALAAGATLDLAATLANQAASVVVGKPGTATVSIQELRETLQK